MPSSSRSPSPLVEEELRLPRPPGAIRRFWARHPLLADVLISLICLVLSMAPGTFISADRDRAAISETALITTNVTLGALVLIACALLLRRRQWPVVAFVAASIVAVAYLVLLGPASGPLLLVASYSVAVYRSTRAAWTGFAVGMTSYALICLLLERIGAISLQSAINGILGELTLCLIGTLIGTNVGGRKRYLEAIIDRSRQLLVERDQQAQIATAAERARIAREMHDIVSHSLTVIVALSEGAAATADPLRGKEASTAAAATARDALADMRSMLGVLRDGDADAPLAPTEPVAPRTTVAAAQRAGFPVTFASAGDQPISPAVEYAIGRIVQEGVTNAMRHAPAATAIDVRIDRTADPVIIEIVNDAATERRGTAGFGLRGLAERAAHVGGSLRSGPDGTGLWSLRAELPTGMVEPPDRPDQEDEPL